MHANINLLPKEDIEKKPLGKFLKWILSYGRYIIISVELIVLLVFFSRFILDRKLADLSDSIEQKRAIIVSAAKLENNIRDLHKSLELIKNLEDGRTVYIKIVDYLKGFTPKDVYYTSIDFDNENINLNGASATKTSFANLLSALKNNEEFEQIDLKEVKRNEEKDLIEFQVSAKIKTIMEKQKQAQAEKDKTRNSQSDETMDETMMLQ